MSFDPDVHVPGAWRCAKCGFRLQQMNLNAQDGTVTSRDQAGDVCPNDGAPLWRVTWKDDALASDALIEAQVNRAVAAEGMLAKLHEAMAVALQFRRLSATQKQREEAHAAIQVWREADAFLKGMRPA